MKDLPIVLEGKVVHGRGIGRSIGCPTANIRVDSHETLPLGVFASRAELEGRVYNAVTNIGPRPTMDDSTEVTVETWIDNLEENIYGMTLTLTLVAFLRPTQRFDSPDLLKAQIHADRDAMRSLLG